MAVGLLVIALGAALGVAGAVRAGAVRARAVRAPRPLNVGLHPPGPWPIPRGARGASRERYVKREELPALVREIHAELHSPQGGGRATYTLENIQRLCRTATETASPEPVHIPNPKDQPSLAEIEQRHGGKP